MGVGIGASALLEQAIPQHGPVRAVDGVLYRDVLESQADGGLDQHIVVPHPHLMQLVGPVELVLNPGRLRAVFGAEPHGRVQGRVLAVFVQARAVDRVLRSDAGIGAGGGGQDAFNPAGERLDDETPDVAGVHGGIGRRVDLVNPPIVRLIEREMTGRVVAGRTLIQAGEHTERVEDAGGGDIVEGSSEIDVVPGGQGPRRPAQDRVAPDIHGLVGGTRVARPYRRAADLALQPRAAVRSHLHASNDRTGAAVGREHESHRSIGVAVEEIGHCLARGRRCPHSPGRRVECQQDAGHVRQVENDVRIEGRSRIVLDARGVVPGDPGGDQVLLGLQHPVNIHGADIMPIVAETDILEDLSCSPDGRDVVDRERHPASGGNVPRFHAGAGGRGGSWARLSVVAHVAVEHGQQIEGCSRLPAAYENEEQNQRKRQYPLLRHLVDPPKGTILMAVRDSHPKLTMQTAHPSQLQML